MEWNGKENSLECKRTAYHYKGRCYIQCPPGTYPSAPLAPEANGTAHRADIDEIAINGQRPLPPSSLRRRHQQQHVVAALMNGGPSTDAPTTDPLPQCLQCHTTCLKCSGPRATDCSECQAAFRFQPIASGGESRICVSINDKRPAGLQPGAGANNGVGRLKAPETAALRTTSPPGSSPAHRVYSYLPSVAFLGGVLVVAFAAIYVLWVHCFQGSPGLIGDLSGTGGLGGDGGGEGAGSSAGLASIRYDRVHTNEPEEVDELYEDDESASSGDDEGDLLSVSATQIIAPIEQR
uniref:Uncharacterized protein n=1 Tax=Anopheles epiroticus TaxID=199890 RepID=A0A182P9M1_9DIPT